MSSRPPCYLIPILFIPVQTWLDNGISYPLVIHFLRILANQSVLVDINPLCNFVGSTKDSFVLVQNNTDVRAISCTGSNDLTGKYLINIYPKITDNVFPEANYARVVKWTDSKYYRCEDMYGYVVEGTFLSNPVEWLFSLTFTPSMQLFIVLLILLGVPTLVLAASRGK